MVAVAARYLDEGNVFDPLMIIAGQNISWPHIMNVFMSVFPQSVIKNCIQFAFAPLRDGFCLISLCSCFLFTSNIGC